MVSQNIWVFSEIVIVLLLNICVNSYTASCQETGNTPSGNTDIQEWVEQHFAKSTVPPFSFIYKGKNSDNFIRDWQYRAEKMETAEPDTEELIYTYTDPKSDLAVKCFVTWHHDFPAVEWVLKFSNNSKKLACY